MVRSEPSPHQLSRRNVAVGTCVVVLQASTIPRFGLEVNSILLQLSNHNPPPPLPRHPGLSRDGSISISIPPGSYLGLCSFKPSPIYSARLLH